jgi:hypothetical protein
MVVKVPVIPQTLKGFAAGQEPTAAPELLMKVPEGVPKATLREV